MEEKRNPRQWIDLTCETKDNRFLKCAEAYGELARICPPSNNNQQDYVRNAASEW